MSEKIEDRRFQRVLGNLNTRESSTLVIATVASSASLVLLGFNLNERVSEDIAGFLFPLAGLLYRELTLFTVDEKDLDELNYYTQGSRSDGESLAGDVRRFVLRFLLASPSALWLVDRIYPDILNHEGPNFFWPILVIALACIALGFAERERNCRLRERRGNYAVPRREASRLP